MRLEMQTLLDLCIFLSWSRQGDVFLWRKEYYYGYRTHISARINGLKLQTSWRWMDGSHSLQGMHWWANDVTLNNFIYILNGWVNVFGWIGRIVLSSFYLNGNIISILYNLNLDFSIQVKHLSCVCDLMSFICMKDLKQQLGMQQSLDNFNSANEKWSPLN